MDSNYNNGDRSHGRHGNSTTSSSSSSFNSSLSIPAMRFVLRTSPSNSYNTTTTNYSSNNTGYGVGVGPIDNNSINVGSTMTNNQHHYANGNNNNMINTNEPLYYNRPYSNDEETQDQLKKTYQLLNFLDEKISRMEKSNGITTSSPSVNRNNNNNNQEKEKEEQDKDITQTQQSYNQNNNNNNNNNNYNNSVNIHNNPAMYSVYRSPIQRPDLGIYGDNDARDTTTNQDSLLFNQSYNLQSSMVGNLQNSHHQQHQENSFTASSLNPSSSGIGDLNRSDFNNSYNSTSTNNNNNNNNNINNSNGINQSLNISSQSQHSSKQNTTTTNTPNSEVILSNLSLVIDSLKTEMYDLQSRHQTINYQPASLLKEEELARIDQQIQLKQYQIQTVSDSILLIKQG